MQVQHQKIELIGLRFGNGCEVHQYANATEALEHIQPGDIVVYSGHSIGEEHVFIVASVDGDRVLTYDAGATFHWREGTAEGTTSGYFNEMRDYSCTVISVDDLTEADIERMHTLQSQTSQEEMRRVLIEYDKNHPE